MNDPRRALPLFLFVVLAFSSCGSSTEAPSSSPPPARPAIAERVTWMGLYMRNIKIGWTRSEVKSAGAGRYELSEETYMRLRAMTTEQESRIDFSVMFTDEFKPVSYRFSMRTTAMDLLAEGAITDTELVTTITTQTGTEVKRYPMDEATDLFGLADLKRAFEGYTVGDVYEGKIFEPNVLGVVPYKIEILDSSTIKLGTEEKAVYRVRSTIASVQSVSIVEADGSLISAEGPMGISMKREDEATAKDFSRAGSVVDLITAFSIDAGMRVAAPEKVRRAVIEIRGLEEPPEGGGVQSSVRVDSGKIRVTVDCDSPAAFAGDASEWLRPSASAQSDDARIVAASRRILEGVAGAHDASAKLSAWVHANMKREPAFTIPSAVEVLASMRGDCNEHAALYCALARAAGIPTRIATGLVYMQGRFYYHAWNEVLLDGVWIPVDATFGEFPAGALRVRFAVGELMDQLKIASFAGKIEATIVEAR